MRIRVVGCGAMGRGIGQWATIAGHSVEFADVAPGAAEEAVSWVVGLLDKSVQRGVLSVGQRTAAGARLTALSSPVEPGPDVDLVIEAIVEDAQVKVELFAQLEQVLPTTTIFASNTSSLSIARLAEKLSDPGRFAGLHFFNPVPLMKVVEVIPGVRTRAEVIELLVDLVIASGHVCVRAVDSPGFVINHCGRGLVTEALALLEENVASAADIDAIARDVLDLRMGPFELMDLTGLDVTSTVMETIWRGFMCEDRLRPSYLSAPRVDGGLLGRKAGEGFYRYPREDTDPSAPAHGDSARPVHVVPNRSGSMELQRFFESQQLADPGVHDDRSVVVIPSWGSSTAQDVAACGLPPQRTVGIDPLSLSSRRLVAVQTAACDRGVTLDLVSVLRRIDPSRRVSVTRDSPSPVAQRLLASIIGVATGVAERGIASPDDIDRGVKAGLGYPLGPMEWAERIGAAEMLALQEGLFLETSDPRYRPSRWLRERAWLGLPVTSPSALLPTEG